MILYDRVPIEDSENAIKKIPIFDHIPPSHRYLAFFQNRVNADIALKTEVMIGF